MGQQTDPHNFVPFKTQQSDEVETVANFAENFEGEDIEVTVNQRRAINKKRTKSPGLS